MYEAYQIISFFSFFHFTVLLQERTSYLEYQKTVRELEHLKRLYIAYQFVQAEV